MSSAAGEFFSILLIMGPLRQFFGTTSVSFVSPLSTMLNASSMIDNAKSISPFEIMSGGMILITGS